MYLNKMGLLRLLILMTSTVGALSDQPEVVLPPPHLDTNLTLALSQISFAGNCTYLHPGLGLGAEFQRREAAYLNAERAIQSIWGITMQPGRPPFTEVRKACSKRNVIAALGDADRAIAAQDQVYDRTTALMAHGVWLGPMRLCGGVVTRAEVGESEMSPQPTLEIQLNDAGAVTLAEFTRRNVGGDLTIRLNGQLFSRPTIHEPLESGGLITTGLDVATLNVIKDELAESC